MFLGWVDKYANSLPLSDTVEGSSLTGPGQPGLDNFFI